MGTTLTGTTPQDTYDSLIKVTDNGPISATGKYLSDGLGNDSVLALSTTKVGINTSSPDVNLHISGDANGRASLRLASTAANRLAAVSFYGNNVESAVIGYEGGSEIVSGGVQGDLIIRNVLSGKDIILDTNAGNVGIGTLAPNRKLVVVSAESEQLILTSTAASNLCGMFINPANTTFSPFIGGTGNDAVVRIEAAERIRVTANGLTFNGDTAAANALDDYEEGTWTMGVSFGGASVGVTYGINTGAYTKIGRKVTVTGYLALSSKGSSTGQAKITGLPFAIGTGGQFSCAANGFLNNTSYTGIPQMIGLSAASVVEFYQLSVLGALSTLTDANFANNSEVYLSFTYFV